MASEQAAKKLEDKADKPARREAPPAPEAAIPRNPLRELSRRQALFLAALIVVANIPLLHYLVRHVVMAQPVSTTVPFQDTFDRTELGPNYWTTGGEWRIENGELHSPGVKNNPLWLKADLPDNVAVDLDVRSMGREGDIKFELFGDGLNHSSGYVFLFGGWNNQITAIARLDEHAPSFDANGIGMPGGDDNQRAVAGRSLDELSSTGAWGPSSPWRIERHDLHVEPGRTYHMHVERRDGLIRWYIDNQLALQVQDRYPLKGKHHDRFGPSSWDTDLYFDNLSIQPL